MPKGNCQRCGFNRELRHLRTEWTGLKVCRDTCWDPKPADMSPPRVGPEGLPLPHASPEPADAVLSPGDVTENDL